MPQQSVSDARAALIDAGITGLHQSHARPANLKKIHALVQGRDPEATFGLSGMTERSPTEVLGYMAELTGCPPDLDDVTSDDSIDPDRTMAGITAGAQRLADAARAGRRLLIATGHPTGLLEHHVRVADAYRSAGGKLVCPLEGDNLSSNGHVEVRYIGSVGCVADWGSLKHTHSSKAMEMLLDGADHPDLVLGDHGFAGAAIERGIPTVAVMDINDPALAVAWGTGKDVVIIPMDDNRPPRLYEPSWRLFEDALGRN